MRKQLMAMRKILEFRIQVLELEVLVPMMMKMMIIFPTEKMLVDNSLIPGVIIKIIF